MTQEKAEYQPSNKQFFEAHDVIGLLMEFRSPELIEAQVGRMPPKTKDLLFDYLVVIDPELNARHFQPIAAALWRDLTVREKILAYQGTWPRERRELFQRRMAGHSNGTAAPSRPDPQTGTALLARAISPPAPIVDNLVHEGMLLLGGKSKRGKSWLMLDLALSVATGKPVWGWHFPVDEPQPVLYLALEDGEARIQKRLRAIQPDISVADGLHLLYDFPLLTHGGIEDLRYYIETWHFRLVVIDVLARVEPAARGGSEKTYHDIYGMFAPLRALHRQYPFCLALVTHLRKAEADDVFDTLHGSVAYQGPQDVLWVMERRSQEEAGVLHVRDKDTEDRALHVAFVDGHWEYVGDGEELKVSRERKAIREVLCEENRPLSPAEVGKILSGRRGSYDSLRKTMQRMTNDGQLLRVERGRYLAAQDASQRELDFP